jgi:hypothetical protein
VSRRVQIERDFTSRADTMEERAEGGAEQGKLGTRIAMLQENARYQGEWRKGKGERLAYSVETSNKRVGARTH